MLIATGEDPNVDVTNSEIYSSALQPGADSFLEEVRTHHDEALRTALEMYKSDSESEMLELCSRVLCEVDISFAKDRCLSCPEFFSICILVMICRATELAMELDQTAVTEADIQRITSSLPSRSFTKSKSLEILLGLVRTNGYNAFEAIAQATRSKPYNRGKDGTDLLCYVEKCLFKLRPRSPRPPRDIKDLQIEVASASDKRKMVIAMTLPDRSAPSGRKKAGASGDANKPNHRSSVSSKQRLPATDQETEDLIDASEDDEDDDDDADD